MNSHRISFDIMIFTHETVVLYGAQPLTQCFYFFILTFCTMMWWLQLRCVLCYRVTVVYCFRKEFYNFTRYNGVCVCVCGWVCAFLFWLCTLVCAFANVWHLLCACIVHWLFTVSVCSSHSLMNATMAKSQWQKMIFEWHEIQIRLTTVVDLTHIKICRNTPPLMIF